MCTTVIHNTTQHIRTVLIISPLILQAITIAQMMSTGAEGVSLQAQSNSDHTKAVNSQQPSWTLASNLLDNHCHRYFITTTPTTRFPTFPRIATKQQGARQRSKSWGNRDPRRWRRRRGRKWGRGIPARHSPQTTPPSPRQTWNTLPCVVWILDVVHFIIIIIKNVLI